MTTNHLQALEALTGKIVGDVAGAMGVLMAWIGDATGLYGKLVDAGPCAA